MKSKAVQAWEPSPLDAINLAAIRYYAIEIEQLSISVYASDRNKTLFPKLEQLLAKTVKDIQTLGKTTSARSGDDCADGYILCDDGLCHPPGTCS